MSKLIKDCTGVVLAGGENTRMPVPKAFIKVNGRPMIERNLALLQQVFERTVIITNDPPAYSHLDTPLFGDVHDIRGPMTGIFTALLNSPTPWVFVSACDMPFMSRDLMVHMYSQRTGLDAVVPKSQGGVEPLFAFYSKRLLSSMEKALLSDRKGLRDFLNNKKVKYISAAEVSRLDPGARSFVNLNTPADADLHIGLDIN